ncbi:MAG: cell envelope biogenesis protein TolA [Alphaproteobacteria bacterium]|nr:cell envelope biogenesis protein TolA [Alphaproteobacteria bacterium]
MALPENPGLAVSGSAHLALLLLALLSFSGQPPESEESESIPVAVISKDTFSQIMKGEKTAKEVKPHPRAEKLADLATPNKEPAPREAEKDVPAEPSALKRQAEPGQTEETPKAPNAVRPPPRPAQEIAKPAVKTPPLPQKPTPAPPSKPPVAQVAEADLPKPPPKPVVEPPKKAEPKFKPDELAKLLEEDKPKEKPKAKPVVKPKSGDESPEAQKKFDPGDIANLLSKETPQRKPSTGRELTQTAALGAPTASAAKMSPSMWDQLDGYLQEQYKRCWTFVGLGGPQKYVAEIHVHYSPDGSLIGQPVLLNPPTDPALRSLAESAVRAVQRCNPLRIPAQYQPFYEQWKGRIVRFDPEEML